MNFELASLHETCWTCLNLPDLLGSFDLFAFFDLFDLLNLLEIVKVPQRVQPVGHVQPVESAGPQLLRHELSIFYVQIS